MEVFADLHVHVGRAGGRTIKITASRDLTLDNIVAAAARKGLGMVGIVDAGCPPVLQEIETRIRDGRWQENENGGFVAGQVTVIPACELETAEGVHVLSLLPDLDALRQFSRWWWPRVTNPGLSTQHTRTRAGEIMARTHQVGGLFGFAHAYTPHKGVYGCWLARLAEGLGEQGAEVDFLELGLSADASMALSISECSSYPFLSNSDAHSMPNVAREYNLLEIASPGFSELRLALRGEDARRVIANYGMPPALGKYHRTCCLDCGYIVAEEPPVFTCPHCGSGKVVMGVMDRVSSLADRPDYDADRRYEYRVPLLMLPGIGRKTAEKLVDRFGSELEVMERVPLDDIKREAGVKAAEAIDRLRRQQYKVIPGGGGRYGSLTTGVDPD